MLPKACLQRRHPKAAQCYLCNRHGVTVYHSHRRIGASHLVFEGSLAEGVYLGLHASQHLRERRTKQEIVLEIVARWHFHGLCSFLPALGWILACRTEPSAG